MRARTVQVRAVLHVRNVHAMAAGRGYPSGARDYPGPHLGKQK